jgi:hypothetical protein
VKRLIAIAALLLTAWAFALDVTVDPAAGLLEGDVEAALGDWRAAGVDPSSVNASLTIRFGPAARFGSDVQAWLVVLPPAEDGVRRYELLVAPGTASIRAALIPALGVVLGGALGDGALNPVLDAAGARRPSAADAQRIEALRSAIPGDLDGNGRVDFEDLLLMAEAFGRRGVNLPADLDGDGVVGPEDLEILRAAYTFTPPSTTPGN